MGSSSAFAEKWPESDFDYFSRRALEEGRAATRAGSAVTAAAHRRMAAVYAAMLVRDLPEDPEIDDLLRQLD